MLDFLKESVRKQMGYDPIFEAVNETPDEVKDQFIDGDAQLEDAEDDPEIRKLVDAIPEEDDLDTEALTDEDIAAMAESLIYTEGTDEPSEDDDDDSDDDKKKSKAEEAEDDVAAESFMFDGMDMLFEADESEDSDDDSDDSDDDDDTDDDDDDKKKKSKKDKATEEGFMFDDIDMMAMMEADVDVELEDLEDDVVDESDSMDDEDLDVDEVVDESFFLF